MTRQLLLPRNVVEKFMLDPSMGVANLKIVFYFVGIMFSHIKYTNSTHLAS